MPVGRWFVDENLIKVGRALAQVRSDVVYPGSPWLRTVPRGAEDDLWLPVAGQSGWAVITRDRRIRSRPVERRRFEEYGVRAFCLTGRNEMTDWVKLGVIVRMWDRMESAYDSLGPGPWMCSVTSAGVEQMHVL